MWSPRARTQAHGGGGGGGVFPGYISSGGHQANRERAGPGGRKTNLLRAWLTSVFRISLVTYPLAEGLTDSSGEPGVTGR